MTPERFADWLQGFVEIQDADSITEKQWLIIKDHLKLVFDKKTPDRSLDVNFETVGTPNYKQLSDLIGKEWPYNKTFPPYTATC